MSLREDVAQHLRAGATGLWIETHEETRVLPELQAASALTGYDGWKWSMTTGITSLKGDRHMTRAKMPEALAYWAGQMVDENKKSLLVLCDIHEHLNPGVKRQMREIMDAGDCGPLISVSPTSEIPVELQRLMLPLPFRLPDSKDLIKIPTSLGWALDDPNKRMLAEASVGLTMHEARIAMKLAAERKGSTKRWQDVASEIWDLKSRLFENKGLVVVNDPVDTWDDVGGAYEFKKWVESRIKVFSPEARIAGVPIPRGVLFVGPYGTGKSLLSRVIAKRLGWRYLEINLGKLMNPYTGVTERNTRELLQLIEVHIPCVVRLDEIAQQTAGHESSGFTDSGTVSRMIGSLLTWMEERRDGVFIVASTNEPWRLPPHMVRAGRFDAIFHIPLPDEDAIGEILGIHLRKYAGEAKVETDQIVETMKERLFAGAEVEQAVIETVQSSWPGKPTTKGLMEATRQIVSAAVTMEEHVGRLTSWAKQRARRA